MAHGYAAYTDAVKTDASPILVLDAFNEHRILAALRDGPRGAAGIGWQIERLIRKAMDHPGDTGGLWFPGRVVMVQENDYGVRLFNGDIGVALPDGEGFLVWFKSQDNELRALAPQRLPRHTQAFALTVHKAQGSEFRRMALVLPGKASRVLTRELLYTAVTRAREHVEILASENRIREAIDHPSSRAGGLLSRLWGFNGKAALT